ncbi:hypothetical protein [Thiocapsa bogorovii]|uniref:hypothetical protein n=1 Tax=Thiocapsa bogorovii TaxID=521689 RepID=UPI001E603986|nr:hypothetical protein [Thiocapsa bogorovii]UHD17883.1 hypothetical protein LT988_07500 [Thiocapsa bogorovii]
MLLIKTVRLTDCGDGLQAALRKSRRYRGLSAEPRRDRLDMPARVERIGTERKTTERIACRGVNCLQGLPEQPSEVQ